MAQQQSKSKTAYRNFVTVSRMILDYARGETVTNEVEMSSKIADLMAQVEDKSAELFGGVIFSNTSNESLWESRFRERVDYIRDKITENLWDKIYDEEMSDGDSAERDAVAFGTDVDTWLDFLSYGIDWSISSKGRDKERVTAYTDLGDFINDFAHISSSVEHVRFTGRFYKITVTDSARSSRRRSGKNR